MIKVLYQNSSGKLFDLESVTVKEVLERVFHTEFSHSYQQISDNVIVVVFNRIQKLGHI